MRPEAIEAKWTEEILKERGLKAPIGQVKALPASQAPKKLMEAAATAPGRPTTRSPLLRETTPFGEASGALLARIAALARLARYGAGARIYSPDDPADDIFVVVSGRVEHVLDPEVGAREAVKRVTRGGVFGWTGLLLGQTRRLATVTAARADRGAAHQHRGARSAARIRAARGRAASWSASSP